eukprot:57699-Rhodomonas_salina.1
MPLYISAPRPVLTYYASGAGVGHTAGVLWVCYGKSGTEIWRGGTTRKEWSACEPLRNGDGPKRGG